MAKIYGQLEEAQLEILSADPGTPKTAQIYWDTTAKSVKVYSGSTVITLGQVAGIGSGAGLQWFQTSGGPAESEENEQRVYLYEAGLTQDLVIFYRVPTNYLAGDSLTLNIGVYSASTTGTIQMDAVSTLIRQDSDAIDSTSLQHTKNGTTLTNTTTNQLRTVPIVIVDSNGQLAATAVAAGNLIKIQLQRGTDTDSADIRFIPSYSEIA
jgi:hypothetical protein